MVLGKFVESFLNFSTGKSDKEVARGELVDIAAGTGEPAVPDGYVITYIVDEPRRVTGGVTTLFGTNEGSLVILLLLQWLLTDAAATATAYSLYASTAIKIMPTAYFYAIYPPIRDIGSSMFFNALVCIDSFLPIFCFRP